MKLEKSNIEQIKISFANMQSREDLLILLNEVKPVVYGENTKPFELKQLTWYANSVVNKKRYKEFNIQKKSGSLRTINAPVAGLKAIQRTLNIILQCVFEPHDSSYGFINDRSIVDNGRFHVGAKYIFNTDIQDFFTSISQARLYKCLQLKPFLLTDLNESLNSENIIFLNTGVRIFTTEFNENVRYKIINGNLGILNDSAGEYENFKNRIAKKLNLEFVDLTGLKNIEIIKASINNDHNSKIIKEEAMKYIATDENSVKLSSLISSRKQIANLISNLCCTELTTKHKDKNGVELNITKKFLPQGAPTSPIISNIVCQKLDHRLTGLAKRFGLKYTRYADDITFSSMHNVYQIGSEFNIELRRIITDQGFQLNENKTRLQKEGYRKEVTGLLVNERVNVQKRYIKQIRMWLYYWENYGYERAYNFFIKQYVKDKKGLIKGKPNMANVIGGKLDYLKMVKGPDNELYIKLKNRFDILAKKKSKISSLLDIWEFKGIDLAMEKLYGKLKEDEAKAMSNPLKKSNESHEEEFEFHGITMDDINNIEYFDNGITTEDLEDLPKNIDDIKDNPDWEILL
jgi:hypothetical protein